MAASYETLANWFDRGIEQEATHMIIVVDEFDYNDYAMYHTGTAEEIKRKVEIINQQNMQRVMGVYNLAKDKKEQFDQHRCWEY